MRTIIREKRANISYATSVNWCGYVETVNAPYTSVSATWTQPTTSGSSSSSAAAFWVGFDGWAGSGMGAVEQCGTQAAGAGGTGVWYELYPTGEVDYSTSAYPLAAGDVITAGVSFNGTYLDLALTDTTKGWTYTVQKGIRAAEIEQGSDFIGFSSAEIIVEDYLLGHLYDFGTVTFTGITPTMTAPIAVTCVNATSSDIEMSPGSLSNGSFTVTWLASS